jgi:hypothetical protein
VRERRRLFSAFFDPSLTRFRATATANRGARVFVAVTRHQRAAPRVDAQPATFKTRVRIVALRAA